MPDIDIIKTRNCPNCKKSFSTFEDVTVEIVCDKCRKNIEILCRVEGSNVIVVKPCPCGGENK